jgi:Rod binding domain-containing protein
MNSTALNNLALSAAEPATKLSRRLPVSERGEGTFDARLKNAGDAMTAARQLVSTAFVQPMLAQMRDDPFRSDLFHGGFAEDAFAQQLETQLADRITQKLSSGQPIDGSLPQSGSGLSLVDSIYRRLMRQPQPVAGAGRFDTRG